MQLRVVSASGKNGGLAKRRGVAGISRAVAAVERLEDRRLLSMTLTNGVLNIVGTPGPDTITIQYTADSTNLVRVKGEGFRESFPADEISKINVNGGGGGDSITLSDAHGVLAIPTKIHGGPGNETVVGSSFGDDTLVGGGGQNIVEGSGSDNLIKGGSGKTDTLVGGTSDDIVPGPGQNLVSTNNGQSFTIVSSTTVAPVNLPTGASTATLAPLSIASTSGGTSPDGIVNPFVLGYTPEQVRTAYGFGALNNPTTTLLGQGQTIAIVDAFDSTTVLNDLTVFSQQFGLPVPTAQTFEKVFAANSQPGIDAGFDGEIDLDVEWAHAIAPDAKIILVEAATNSFPDLFNAISIAGSLVANSATGGGVVSMSFGGAEQSPTALPTQASMEYTLDQVFNQYPTVSFIAASGDTEGEMSYPAMSPYVTSVGGTTLNINADGVRTSKTTPWIDSGGGVSIVEPEPNFQAQTLGATPLLTNEVDSARVGPDVAFLANPSTGVAVYNTSPSFPAGDGGFQDFGGTSLACPMFAATVALGNQARIANGQPVIGSNLNNAIYEMNVAFPGRDFSLAGVAGFSDTPGADTGWGEPIPSTFISDLSTLGINGYTQPIYADNINVANIKASLTLVGDFNAPIGGSSQATDSYLGTGTATSTGPTTFTLILNLADSLQNSISLTGAMTINDLNTGAFTGFITNQTLFTSPTLPAGATLGVYVTGNVTPHSNDTADVDGEFYGAVENPDGTFTRIGNGGVNGSGDGTLYGSFETD